MAKVRVPKELRPPERFKAFKAPEGSDEDCIGMWFRVEGAFRPPRPDDYFWYGSGPWSQVGRSVINFETSRVILERVEEGEA